MIVPLPHLATSITRAIALMMVAANTSETSVSVCQTTRHKNPEDSHLRTRRRENLKSNNLIGFCSKII
jgi:hypothetical protein